MHQRPARVVLFGAFAIGAAMSILDAGAAAPFSSAGTKSGYLVGEERCGHGTTAFPKLRIGTRPGYCVGLVASKADGLIFPRSIVQVPGSNLFVIADMGGWSPKRGRLLLLDPEANEGRRIKVLLSQLDFLHGLAVGIDRRIYASTDEKIFRFDPLAQKPEATVQVIIQGLPGWKTALSDGTKVEKNSHPLKHFVFDKMGRIYINVGAPSDSCVTKGQESKPCAAGEGPAPFASVWVFAPPSGGNLSGPEVWCNEPSA